MTQPLAGEDSEPQPLAGEHGVYVNERLTALEGLGLFGAKVVLADMDGDTYPDLVMSSGEMRTPQPIVVYRNTAAQKPFRHRPSWFSGRIAHRGALAVGDVNGDGLADLVVPVLHDNAANPGTGRLEVFVNDRILGLPLDASYSIALPNTPLAVALGDVDGDADLDAAVAAITLDPQDGAVGPAAQQVYFNDNGRLQVEGAWQGPVMGAVTPLFADFNLDGWLDLALGGERVAIIHGGGGTHSWGERISWLDPPFSAAYGLSAGPLESPSALSLVVADNCRRQDGDCSTGLWLFSPGADRFPAKGTRVRDLDNGAQVRLVDGNQDGHPDLIVTQLGTRERGAPILLLQGGRESASFTEQFVTPPARANSIAVGDPWMKRAQRETFATSTFAHSVVTLPRQHVSCIREVWLDGRRLPRNEFAWAPDNNWLSVKTSDNATHELRVEYVWPRRQTIIAASQDPALGPIILKSYYHDPATTGYPYPQTGVSNVSDCTCC